jgi:hypothetical protein
MRERKRETVELFWPKLTPFEHFKRNAAFSGGPTNLVKLFIV